MWIGIPVVILYAVGLDVSLTFALEPCGSHVHQYRFRSSPTSGEWESLLWAKLLFLPDASKISCGRKCIELDNACKAFATKENGNCVVLGELADLSQTLWINSAGDWQLYLWETTEIEMPVFRVSAGSGVSAADTWVSGSASRLSQTDTARDVDLSSPLTGFYKHPLVDNWANWTITKVKLTLYTNSAQVVQLEFSGPGSTSMSWFSKQALESSPWTDLTGTATTNLFGIKPSSIARVFFINSSYGGCGNDVGWFVVLDGQDNCGWSHRPLYPAFSYMAGTNKRNWLSSYVRDADEMVVSVILQL